METVSGLSWIDDVVILSKVERRSVDAEVVTVEDIMVTDNHMELDAPFSSVDQRNEFLPNQETSSRCPF